MKIITGIRVFPFHEWTLIISKMVERKAFLANPKHQYHATQWEEHVYSANNKKNEGYFGYPGFLTPWMNINYKENDGKKCFSSESKAPILCTLMRRTWF